MNQGKRHDQTKYSNILTALCLTAVIITVLVVAFKNIGIILDML
jgi:hypothetical protein